MLHELVQMWFGWVRDWGYPGIFLLMAMESSIFPVPSEIVVPPAAYWAAQGRFSFLGVVVASTLGSLFGSLVTYLVARVIGRPLVMRFGRYLLMPPEKIARAEAFLRRYENGGIFFSRLLPVIRHLCSIPAGMMQMAPLKFSVLTTVGAGIWCTILAWFGQEVIGDRPDLMENPDALISALKAKLLWFIVGAVVMLVAYVVARRLSADPQEAPSKAAE